MPDTPAPSISADDRGFLLGDGVFDTSMVLNGRMMFRQAHIDRLALSARALGLPHDLTELGHEIDAAIEGVEAARLRITLSRGVTSPGLDSSLPDPTTLIRLHKLDLNRPFHPTSAILSDVMRSDHTPSSQHKTLSYIDNVMAQREAASKSAGCALMANRDGEIVCGASENVFVLEDKTLITPPLNAGALAGTLRRWVIEESGKLGLSIREEPLSDARLVNADAAFVTNSLRLVAPISRFGGIQLGTTWPDALVELAHHLLHDLKRQCGGRTPFGRPNKGQPYTGKQDA